MTNNDILRRIRYTFDFNDFKMIELFGLADLEVTRSMVSNWLKAEDELSYQKLLDKELAIFLNGLIIHNRGKRDDKAPVIEEYLDNNMVLKKLKIALNLKTDDILAVFKLIGKNIGSHELSAFFRNPKQSQYRQCNDQYLRQFLSGLQKKYRID